MTTIKTANRPKVSDIAQAAGVSPATVSKVINGRDGVSDETRDRVELLLEEAGFRKKLPTTKTMRSIELVVNEMTNNGSVEMVKETTSYARDFGIGITVSCAGPDFKEYATRNETSNCLRSAIERNPLGVILLLSNISSAEESLLQTRNIPYVIVDPVGQVSADALGVGIDNWTGGMLATQYLISLGHRRIAVITGPTNSQSSQARLSGYMAALQKNGISADPHLIKVGDYVSDKAYKAACDLLEMREQDRPTAIFAFNDLGAINVYRAARQHGISLPTVIDHRFRRCRSCGKHVSVFDDHQAAIRPHRQTMHRSDSRSTGGKGGTELLHSSHAARRTRKLRISSTAVVRQEHFTHSPFSAFILFIPVDDMDQAKNIRDNGKSAITGTTLSTKHPCICNMPPSQAFISVYQMKIQKKR